MGILGGVSWKTREKLGGHPLGGCLRNSWVGERLEEEEVEEEIEVEETPGGRAEEAAVWGDTPPRFGFPSGIGAPPFRSTPSLPPRWRGGSRPPRPGRPPKLDLLSAPRVGWLLAWVLGLQGICLCKSVCKSGVHRPAGREIPAGRPPPPPRHLLESSGVARLGVRGAGVGLAGVRASCQRACVCVSECVTCVSAPATGQGGGCGAGCGVPGPAALPCRPPVRLSFRPCPPVCPPVCLSVCLCARHGGSPGTRGEVTVTPASGFCAGVGWGSRPRSLGKGAPIRSVGRDPIASRGRTYLSPPLSLLFGAPRRPPIVSPPSLAPARPECQTWGGLGMSLRRPPLAMETRGGVGKRPFPPGAGLRGENSGGAPLFQTLTPVPPLRLAGPVLVVGGWVGRWVGGRRLAQVRGAGFPAPGCPGGAPQPACLLRGKTRCCGNGLGGWVGGFGGCLARVPLPRTHLGAGGSREGGEGVLPGVLPAAPWVGLRGQRRPGGASRAGRPPPPPPRLLGLCCRCARAPRLPHCGSRGPINRASGRRAPEPGVERAGELGAGPSRADPQAPAPPLSSRSCE